MLLTASTRQGLFVVGTNQVDAFYLVHAGFTTVSGNLEMGNLNLPIHITDSYNNERDVPEVKTYKTNKSLMTFS